MGEGLLTASLTAPRGRPISLAPSSPTMPSRVAGQTPRGDPPTQSARRPTSCRQHQRHPQYHTWASRGIARLFVTSRVNQSEPPCGCIKRLACIQAADVMRMVRRNHVCWSVYTTSYDNKLDFLRKKWCNTHTCKFPWQDQKQHHFWMHVYMQILQATYTSRSGNDTTTHVAVAR